MFIIHIFDIHDLNEEILISISYKYSFFFPLKNLLFSFGIRRKAHGATNSTG